MAKCSRCGASVGCGCNLKNGMCAFCAQKTKDEDIIVRTSNKN
jgi:hypothetical protein